MKSDTLVVEWRFELNRDTIFVWKKLKCIAY